MDQETKDKLLERKYMARMMAVQALYSQEVLGEERKTWDFDSLDDELIDYFHNQARGKESDKKIDKKFFKVITEGASLKSSDLDNIILQYFDDEWNQNRLGPLLMSILRLATFEITQQDTPARIAISEYINIADDFFDEDEVSFVNAVLDKVARNYTHKQSFNEIESRQKTKKDYSKKAPIVVKKAKTIKIEGQKLSLKDNNSPE